MESDTLVLTGAFAIGLMAGFVARRARFCTFGAIEDHLMSGSSTRLRTWVLAIAVAMIGVQVLLVMGAAAIEDTFYLAPEINPMALFFGGLCFGIGMAMVGNCSFGMLVRLGGGDLRSLFVFIIMGLTAYATARGLPGLLRLEVFGPFMVDLAPFESQGAGHIIAAVLELQAGPVALAVGTALAAVCIVYCICDPHFRRPNRDTIAGLVVGLSVVAGFWLTGGPGQEGFDVTPVRSLTYVLPPGESIQYILTFTGAELTFPVSVTAGTLVGVWLAAASDKTVRLGGYDDAREMRRHAAGAVLMGFGGVTALGCTIGQGVSGLATLSIGAPMAMAGILMGAVVGIRMLIAGSFTDAVQSLLPGRS